MTPDEFAAAAVRVPFVDLGRDWNGWDCWGLVHCAYRECLRVDLPSFAGGYANAGNTVESREQLLRLSDAERHRWRPAGAPEPLDVVLMIVTGRPIHVGLFLGGGRFIHAERKLGTMIERMASPMWSRRIEGVYRLE